MELNIILTEPARKLERHRTFSCMGTGALPKTGVAAL